MEDASVPEDPGISSLISLQTLKWAGSPFSIGGRTGSVYLGSTKQHHCAGNESFCSAVSAAEVHSIKHQLATEFVEIRLLQ